LTRIDRHFQALQKAAPRLNMDEDSPLRFRMRKILLLVIASLSVCALLTSSTRVKPVAAASGSGISYDKDGNLLVPDRYREWIYLSSGVNMSYTETSESKHDMFDNVFVNPEAYQTFRKTGTWPDKTTFLLEVREARNKGSINLRGHYQGTDVMGIEVHAKDESRFPGKWAFFEVESSSMKGKLIPQTANCYSCHAEHGAVDSTFVQFYPTLLPIAEQKHTLSRTYLDETAAKEAKQ
jgi:hypothetical protein